MEEVIKTGHPVRNKSHLTSYIGIIPLRQLPALAKTYPVGCLPIRHPATVEYLFTNRERWQKVESNP